jgi:DNA-binding transcriptional MerR regulator
MSYNFDKNLSTGQFATLCGVNKRTLLHYEDIGIFSPSMIADNGYRYYSYDQFQTFVTILGLKEIGMPLSEIGTFLQNKSPDELKSFLNEKREALNKEIDSLRRTLMIVDQRLDNLETAGSLDLYSVFFKELPEEYILLDEKVMPRYDEAHYFEFYIYIIGKRLNDDATLGRSFGISIPMESLIGSDFFGSIRLFTKLTRRVDSPLCVTKQGGMYAIGYQKGSVTDLSPTYARLMESIRSNGMEICGPSYEETIIEGLSVGTLDEYIIRVSIPVRKLG